MAEIPSNSGTIERQALFWLALAAVLLFLVSLLSPVLLPFVVGIVLAYFLNPLVDGMVKLRLPRWLAAVIVLAALAGLVVLALIFVVPTLAQQAADFVEAAPHQIEQLKTLIADQARDYLGTRYPKAEEAVRSGLESLSSGAPALIGALAQSLWNQGSAAFSLVSVLLIAPLVLFYALLDWPKIMGKLDSWLPLEHADQIRALAAEINARISAFLRGQGTVCLLLAAFYALGLSIVGLNYGLLVGLLTGLAAFIPVVGWWVGMLTAVSLAAVQFWPDYVNVLAVLGVMVAGMILENAVLTPNIVGSNVGLHPMWIIFALMTFGYLFGFLGLLVAVPVSAAIGVLVRFALHSYLASSFYKGIGQAEG